MNMHVNLMIVGQGISGTCLTHFAEKAGLSFLVFDSSVANTASKVASGIINPVTGRRMVKSWMIEDLMASARNFYNQVGFELGMECIKETRMVDFFPTPQMMIAFRQRVEQGDGYLTIPADRHFYDNDFFYDFGYGEIEPVYLVQVGEMLDAFRKKLRQSERLVEEPFDIACMKVFPDQLQYKDHTAEKIVFCDGVQGFTNPYFKSLPFALNKGEALIIAPEQPLPPGIFKKGLLLVPWQNGYFWVGSSYQWEYWDSLPTPAFKDQVVGVLASWIKTGFRVVDHMAALRPATIERRPFVGFHPRFASVGILNGMGTKGCSLAPYFARELVGHIMSQSPLPAEVSIGRFARLLGTPK